MRDLAGFHTERLQGGGKGQRGRSRVHHHVTGTIHGNFEDFHRVSSFKTARDDPAQGNGNVGRGLRCLSGEGQNVALEGLKLVPS